MNRIKPNYILITFAVMVLSETVWAQRPHATPQEVVDMQVKKTNAGISCFQLNWDIDSNEYFEDKESMGIGKAFNFGYGYFFSNQTSVWLKVGFCSFVNRVPTPDISAYRRDFHLQFSVRRFFFKRAAFYVELGGQMGAFRRQGGAFDQDVESIYYAPMVSVGYGYLIIDLHPILDQHLGVEFGVTSLIPLQKSMTYDFSGIGFFPEVVLQFGVNYKL